MTPFAFEHVYRAGSAAEVFAAYWDPGQQAAQDARMEIAEREVVALVDTAEERVRTSRVVPKRQLPAFVRPFIRGQLHYVETARWQKAADAIDLEIRPSLLGGRATVTARYRLVAAGAGRIKRLYEGCVSVDVALVAGRIERGIVAEFERSMPIAAEVTQAWLDGGGSAGRSVSARA